LLVRKIGVEEEQLLVDPVSGRLTAVAHKAIRAHQQGPIRLDEPEVGEELFLQQIETATLPCERLEDLAEQVRRGRSAVRKAAADAGAAGAAMPVPILVDEDARVTPKPRYRRIHEEFGELAKSSLACAMHVHVEVEGDAERVTVLDGIGPWLPVLLAVSANSPYWLGRDTGYASWRAQIWTRWPGHGTGQAFGTAETYRETSRRLVEWGAALDPGMVYFDARLSPDYPTVEIRVCDVCTDPDDAVLLAALGRALVETAARGQAGASKAWRSDLLRAASWRASRYGIAGRLVDPRTMELADAREVVGSLVAQCAPALAEAGDLELVQHLTERLFAQGGGATRQRRTFEETRSLGAVVADLCTRTEQSADVSVR
jgi:glutamate---cysteine ligase / carboxylate-amine ligase